MQPPQFKGVYDLKSDGGLTYLVIEWGPKFCGGGLKVLYAAGLVLAIHTVNQKGLRAVEENKRVPSMFV